MTNQTETVLVLDTLDKFEAALGEPFVVPFEGEEFVLTLAEVKPSRYGPAPGVERQPFSLLFRCTDERVLPQGTYELTHKTLGASAIFIVPVGSDANGISYEAVFN